MKEGKGSSNKAKTWTTVQDFIKDHTVEKGLEYTHTSLNAPPSSFYVPSDHLDLYYTLYEKAIAAGNDLYITEKNRHIGPVLVDLDLRFVIGSGSARQYTDSTLDQIVAVYIGIVQKYLDVGASSWACVMEKSQPVECKGIVKDGIHIVFPQVVTRASVKHVIRNEVMPLLEPLMKSIGSTNKIDDIVDESIIERNNWFMFGSKKKGGEPYVVTRVYEFGPTGPAELTDRTVVFDETPSLVQLLSIRNKNSETHVRADMKAAIAEFENAEEEVRRNKAIVKKIVGSETNNKECYYENLTQIEALVDLLDLERGKVYESWIRLGWCLRNIDNRLLGKWDEFSAKSDPRKYKAGECEKMWDKMKECGLGVGSLHMWARADNPDAYKELLKSDLKNLMYMSMSGTHYDIAKVVYGMFQHEFVCSSFRNRLWYHFKNHRWNLTDSGVSLRNRLSEDVWRLYKAEINELNIKSMAASRVNQDVTNYEDLQKKFGDIASKLRNTSFKENIMKECSELFYIDKFEDKLDANTSLIGLNNGVYDLEMHTFRDGRPDDFISFNTNNNYIPYDPHHPIMISINEYLEQVLTSEMVREYVLKLYGTFIAGQVKEQKFYIWTGSGSNSKSLLVEFFEKTLGDYCCKFPITLLTQKRCASNAANSELARAKGKRFACLQEPSEDEKINIGLMKELSGGDKIMARALYKEPFEFVPQFKMLLLCNQLPHVPSDDGGTWRRIRVVSFTSKFVDNPNDENENEFQIDYNLSERMEEWREHLMALLIHYYKKYQLEGITEPAEVMKCTTDYKSQNDHMSNYMSNLFEKKDSGFLSLDEAHVELRNWIKNDNIPIKLLAKGDLDRYLTGKMGCASVIHNQVRGFKGWKLKNLVPEEEKQEEGDEDED